MNDIKSLADQLRSRMSSPDIPEKTTITKVKQVKAPPKVDTAEILQEILDFDNSNNKNMVHVRFDDKTSQLLNHFKMATGVDITKLVAFSVHALFQKHPELKQTIKQFIQDLEL